MASMKVRSRRDGAAIPLDETDKQLLNLMQGKFALVERPFAHVAELAGLGLASLDLEEVLADADVAVIVTAHPSVDHDHVADSVPSLVDLRGVTRKAVRKTRPSERFKSRKAPRARREVTS
jgi:UDP-N-acetyl-D-mannosaminuronate dehydrogenase